MKSKIALPVFWAAVATLAWTHAAFPLLLLVRARLKPRPLLTGSRQPSVSVVIAAHDEETVIERRLTNLLEQEYPRAKLQIILASDGSTDGTVHIASRFPEVLVLDLPRVGKTSALNMAVAQADGEVLVFTDANTTFAPGALRAIVSPFNDASVGAVAGDQRYIQRGSGRGEQAHWNLDRVLKRAESAAGSCVSATGALYAIRRDDFDDCPPGVTDDFFISTGAVARKHRLVFSEEAVAYEPVASRTEVEYARKVRIVTQGLRAVLHRRALLDWRRHGFYAVELFTHKLLRRLSVVPLLAASLAAPFLVRRGAVYRFVLLGQLIGLLLAGIGLVGPPSLRRHRLPSLAAFFVMVNAAAIHGLLNLLSRRRVTLWSPTREDDP